MTKARSEQPANSTGRTVGRPFAKGRSGNPGGRPRLPAELRERARAFSVEALDVLHGLAIDPAQPGSVRVSAATAIIDRGYGRPAASLSVDVRSRRSLADYTTDELLALAEQASTPPLLDDSDDGKPEQIN